MLNTPIPVGSLQLKTRLVMPPMATEKSAAGAVTDSLVSYYDRMSAGGYLGLVIQEHSFVSPEGQASPNMVSIADDSCIEPLSRITEVVHRNGVPIIVQINHAGNAARTAVTGLEVISASSVPASRRFSAGDDAPLPRAMTQADIDRVAAHGAV